MSDLIFARAQMGFSLAFHIIFAVAGIALPLMMVIAEALWLKTGDEIYKTITKRWARGTAVLFAVGAVSGTVLSFELGLLWPEFMKWAGSIIGLPFALEGYAFFTEAIFLGIYLYGWDKVSKSMHLLSGCIVALSGALSAVFVVIANAWMNAPVGFKLVGNVATEIDPIMAMTSPAAFPQVLHMLIAAYASIGLLAAGVHAFLLLRDKQNVFHRRALGICLALGCTMALAEPLSGDILAQMVAHTQPIKLAALEGQFDTMRGAPLRIGGLPDVEKRKTPFSIELPKMLSVLAFHELDAEVKGLNDFPRDVWPPVLLVHLNFQIMVACGVIMGLVSLWAGALYAKTKKLPDSSVFLKTLICISPLGLLAIESGWMVTELGRQPWVIHGVLRTSHAVTPMPGLWLPFTTFLFVYIALAVIVVALLFREFSHSLDPVKESDHA
ncbi:MAG: cytochrome ubiquinol oxidase subunit I [Candidatus Melainabacteria bacterium]|nr:MAG: cytochrome ubiquinol oxidase subunit I [Candidatus Melainabacteria bacterium]